MTKLVFLGTAGQLPTKERNVQSLYLEYEGEGILLDCGEGTQRQLSFAGISAQKITKILISHWHGDHSIGLIGLLQTIDSFANEGKTLRIYGPPGSKVFVDHMLKSTVFTPQLDIQVHEIAGVGVETFYACEDYYLQARLLDHNTPCLGYKFVRKARRHIHAEKLPKGLSGPRIGKLQQGEAIEFNGEMIKPEAVSTMTPEQGISFIFDTKKSASCVDIAKGSRVLVSEATFLHDLVDKAEEWHHLTARQAAEIAKEAGVEELILTHFSQRYRDTKDHAKEAQEVFASTRCAEDFLEVVLPF